MSRPSVTIIHIGERDWEKPYDPRCTACTSDLLSLIDGSLAYGWTYERVRAYVRATGAAPPSAEDLRLHVGHLAPPHAAERERLEAAARTAGLNADDGPPMIAPRDLAQLALQRAYERIQDGADVSVRDAAAIIKLRREIDKDSAAEQASADAAQWQEALRTVLWLARKHLGAAWGPFVRDLRSSDDLLAVMPPDQEVPDAAASA